MSAGKPSLPPYRPYGAAHHSPLFGQAKARARIRARAFVCYASAEIQALNCVARKRAISSPAARDRAEARPRPSV